MSERRLWVAVLLMAINDAAYEGEGGSSLREKEIADDWFRTGGNGFRFVCSMVGLDPGCVRKAYIEGRIGGSKLSARRQGRRANCPNIPE